MAVGGKNMQRVRELLHSGNQEVEEWLRYVRLSCELEKKVEEWIGEHMDKWEREEVMVESSSEGKASESEQDLSGL